MRPELLIDAIVRQTTVLIAQLSTATGLRTPLSKVADQVFLELSTELEQQGVTRKVAADMFGLTLRSYQSKVQRLRASRMDRERSLWSDVLQWIEQQQTVSRKDLLEHFKREDPQSLGAILNDLLRSNLIQRTGNNGSTTFQAHGALPDVAAPQSAASLAALIWIAIYRGFDSRGAIAEHFHLDETLMSEALQQLLDEGRVIESDGALRTNGVKIPVGAEQGWEAAIFDHFQTVLTAIGQKVQTPQSRADDRTGGTTITFEVDASHPLRDEVLALLQETRKRTNELWDRVNAHNRAHGVDQNSRQQVSFYFGQSTKQDEEDLP